MSALYSGDHYIVMYRVSVTNCTPAGREIFPIGFAPDISRDTLASALRRQFILTTAKGGGNDRTRTCDAFALD